MSGSDAMPGPSGPPEHPAPSPHPAPIRPGPPPATPGPGRDDGASGLEAALADLESRPVDDLDGTAAAGSALHDRLRDRLDELGRS